MNNELAVRDEDVLPVRSRISWGPIFAGAALALALYFLLALLGAGLGLSVSDGVRPETMGVAAAAWAVLTTALCLFIGGFAVTQLSVGENKVEAVIFGLIMWAVVFSLILWLMASGVRTGLGAMVGMATAGASASDRNWEDLALRANVPPEQIAEWRKKAENAPAEARRAVEDPQSQRAAVETTTKAAWYAFGGTLLSMLAAAVGAYVGGGPTLRLIRPSPVLTNHHNPTAAGRG